MRSLYPEIEPYLQHRLEVHVLHALHVEESGNPDGIPVVFIHGGPGSGSSENHRRYFNPAHYRIINFDQRGCHRSGPQGELRDNTTVDLLLDLEAIRNALGIPQWLLFGGSWGATLALLYAEACPERVTGMILRGTFLARFRDLEWFTGDGARHIFPDAWEDFKAFIPPGEQNDLVGAYYRRVTGTDKTLQIETARHWNTWSGRVVSYLFAETSTDHLPVDQKAVNDVRIETHYAHHYYFIAENRILDEIANIPDVPIMLIHGRRDLTCTLDASWELHKALPGSDLRIVHEGGHLAGEPVMTDALITATDSMAGTLK